MRRKIALYIGEAKADLSDQSFVLFNYAQTDVTKPTAVKNSFTKQVTLPASPANDAIFGDYFRTDRATTGVGNTGTAFNAGRKTPFTIYDDLGQIIETGYVRLDEVTRKGRLATGYKVTLFGGLGAFLYALSYDEDGNKRTLADLDYLGVGDKVGELDFTINAANVRAAWNRLASSPSVRNSIWDVINFAPCYNGIPDGDFSADKAIVTPGNVGLPASQQDEDGNTYGTLADGSALVNLSQPHDEWAVKDLRSYLQRPALSMRAFLDAICNPENNGGYSVDLSDVPLNVYRNLWKLLPAIPSLGTFKQISGSATLFNDWTFRNSGNYLADYEISAGSTIPQGVILDATIRGYYVGTFSRNGYLQLLDESLELYDWGYSGYKSVAFFQAVAYDSNGVALAGSEVLCTDSRFDPSSLAEQLGFTPWWGGTGYVGSTPDIDSVNAGGNIGGGWRPLVFSVKAIGAAYYRIHMKSYYFRITYRYGGQASITNVTDTGILQRFWAQDDLPAINMTSVTFRPKNADESATASSLLTYTDSGKARSGAVVLKSVLLQSAGTPADYLVSFAKMHGLCFLFDGAAKSVKLVRRDTFYGTNEAVVDLTDRIDTGKGLTITPQARAAKWYEFSPSHVGGAFADEYAKTYGIQYGIQRVDTGYDFDAEAQQVVDGLAFKDAASVLESGPYWNYMLLSGSFRPSVFIDKGNTYTLWMASSNETHEFRVPTPPSSTVVNYYNEYGHEGYDSEFAWKAQLHDADGKPVDGTDVLLYFGGFDTYPYFKVSDDSSAMLAANDGTPCWDLNPGAAAGLSVPSFTRYDTDTEWGVERSLDFGVPREVAIPSINFGNGTSLYARCWANYLRDLLDQDTKVLKCRVNLEGLAVGQGILRRFFWYDGSLWVLNKITNYSLTTFDTAECEFIQVREKTNYTNGQNA